MEVPGLARLITRRHDGLQVVSAVCAGEDMAAQQNISKAEIEKQFFANVRPTSLLKRFETPEEVAAVVAFVASTQSEAINGAAVRAEGGVVRSIF